MITTTTSKTNRQRQIDSKREKKEGKDEEGITEYQMSRVMGTKDNGAKAKQGQRVG